MVWVAQILTMMFQLVYAAVTSRAIDPTGFGTFAVALAVTALGGMLASAGLANAAARRTTDDIGGDRAIVTLSLVSGLLIGGAFALTAPLWARLWGNPDATALIRILSIGLVAGSYAGVLTGVARRFGRMGLWTAATLTSSLIAMAVGGYVAQATRAAWSLTVMPVTSSILLALILLVSFGRRGVPGRQLRGVRDDASYGAKSLGSSLGTYVAYGLPVWTMSRWLGASTFGSWNRAVVVGQVPLESAARAVQTVIFPKFRWDGPGGVEVARRRSSLIAAAALVVLPLAALLIPAVPALTLLLLGPQWSEAGVMAQFVLGATAVNVLAGLLGTALEASNNFRAVWMGQVVTISVMAAAAVAMLLLNSWLPMGVGYLLAAAFTHVTQVVSGARSTLVDGTLVGRWYAIATVACVVMIILGWGITSSGGQWPLKVGGLCLFAGLYVAFLYSKRHAIPPFASLLGTRP